MVTAIDDLVSGDLQIHVTQLPPYLIRLDWTGRSNGAEPARTLAPFFGLVINRALDQGSAVEMHFERLAHFNSSTITSIIQLIQDSRARAIKLVLVYDEALKWQKLSFDALRVFARDDLLELRSA